MKQKRCRVLQGAGGPGSYVSGRIFKVLITWLNGLLTWDEHNAVVKEFQRRILMKELKEIICHLCRTKPNTTYDNTVGEWGDKFVPEYDRKGNLRSDLLLTCDLDTREP
jgi:hypothetical protein